MMKLFQTVLLFSLSYCVSAAAYQLLSFAWWVLANIIVDANVLAAIPKVSLDKPNPTSRVQRVAWAAHDLQLYIEKISGAKLPIIGDDQTVPGGVRILVGLRKYTKRYQDEIPAGLSNQREEEGYTILTRSNTLVLAGNEEAPYHGTEYAVCFFYIS
jgi:hypothetical protein